jgi:signal peptidase I
MVETWTERIANLSVPTIVLLLGGLTGLRLVLRALKKNVFLFLAELTESAMLALALVFLLLRPFVLQTYHIPSGSMHPTLREGDHLVVNKLLYRLRAPRRGEIIVFRAPRDADPAEPEYIKRLIGLPGDTIEVKEGYVEVEGIRYSHAEIRGILGVPDSDSEANEKAEVPLRLTPDGIHAGNQTVSASEFAVRVSRRDAPVTIHPGQVLRNGVPLIEDHVAEDPEYHLDPYTIPEGSYFVLGDNRNQSHDSHEWQSLPANRVIGRAEAVFWPLPRVRRTR